MKGANRKEGRQQALPAVSCPTSSNQIMGMMVSGIFPVSLQEKGERAQEEADERMKNGAARRLGRKQEVSLMVAANKRRTKALREHSYVIADTRLM